MLGGLKFGKKKAAASSSVEPPSKKAKPDEFTGEESKYASTGAFQLPTAGGLYDPKNPPKMVLNLPPKPTITTADTRASDLRKGALKNKEHQAQFSKFSEPSNTKSLQSLIDEEKGAKSMDEVFVRNMNRAGSRFKGGDFATDDHGFDEDDQTNMTMFTDKNDRVTELEKWEREKARQIQENNKLSKVQSRCWWWINSENFNKVNMIALGEHTTLVKVPPHLEATRGSVYIVPVTHAASFIECEDEVWDEVVRFKTALANLWKEQGKEVVFTECVLQNAGGMYQSRIECIPVKKGSDFPLFFRSSMMEQIDENEQTHSKIINLKNKIGGPRYALPKGFSYFTVDWSEVGTTSGYAMMIEDERNFPKNLQHDVINGLMNVDTRGRIKGSAEEDRLATLEFLEYWKKHDWTLDLE